MNRADETLGMSEIISRYVLGTMTESEKEELDAWLNKSSRNKLLFEKLWKPPQNISFEAVFGPSGETRTPGILL